MTIMELFTEMSNINAKAVKAAADQDLDALEIYEKMFDVLYESAKARKNEMTKDDAVVYVSILDNQEGILRLKKLLIEIKYINALNELEDLT